MLAWRSWFLLFINARFASNGIFLNIRLQPSCFRQRFACAGKAAMETLENRICHLRLALENWLGRQRLLWVRVLTRRILSRFTKTMNIRNWRRRKNLYERAEVLLCGRAQRYEWQPYFPFPSRRAIIRCYIMQRWVTRAWTRWSISTAHYYSEGYIWIMEKEVSLNRQEPWTPVLISGAKR